MLDIKGNRGEHRGAPLSVGVVGSGYWGPNLMRVLADRNDVELAWICDLQTERLKRSSQRYPSAKATTRSRDLLDDPDLDAVLIVTPVFSHFELASEAVNAGKHTFVEKPLATSTAAADDLLQLAQDNGVVLMCGHTFVYSPAVRAVKDLIDRGELGEIYFITSSRVNLGLHQPDVSVVWDLGPHDFSILRYWLEQLPASISALGRDAIVDGVADVAFVSVQFRSGTLANLEMSWLAPSKLRRTVVVGSKKMVVYEDGAAEPVRVFDHGVVYRDPETFGEYQLSYRTGDIMAPHVEGTEPLALEMEDFIHSVYRGRSPDGHGELCRDVVRMTEAAGLSLCDGGRPVVLDEAPVV